MALTKSYGASGWVVVGSNIALTAGTPVQISDINTIASMLAAGEEDFPFFEVQLEVVSGGATANSKCKIFLRQAEGANQQPVPSSVYRQSFIGAITLSGVASGFFFRRQCENIDKNGTIYLESSDDAITITLSVRVWTWADQ